MGGYFSFTYWINKPFKKDNIDQIIDTLLENGFYYNKWYLGGYLIIENDGKEDSFYEENLDNETDRKKLKSILERIIIQKRGYIIFDILLDNEPCDLMVFFNPANSKIDLTFSIDMTYLRRKPKNWELLHRLIINLFLPLKAEEGSGNIDDCDSPLENFYQLNIIPKSEMEIDDMDLLNKHFLIDNLENEFIIITQKDLFSY